MRRGPLVLVLQTACMQCKNLHPVCHGLVHALPGNDARSLRTGRYHCIEFFPEQLSTKGEAKLARMDFRTTQRRRTLSSTRRRLFVWMGPAPSMGVPRASTTRPSLGAPGEVFREEGSYPVRETAVFRPQRCRQFLADGDIHNGSSALDTVTCRAGSRVVAQPRGFSTNMALH